MVAVVIVVRCPSNRMWIDGDLRHYKRRIIYDAVRQLILELVSLAREDGRAEVPPSMNRLERFVERTRPHVDDVG